MKELGRTFAEVSLDQSRVPAVQRILYAMFAEGYFSSHEQFALRRELCDESMRLATLLVNDPSVRGPETYALLALLHLHASRMNARQDAVGGMVLLEEQDRSLWDMNQIQLGMTYLAQSAHGERFSRYHAEAAIAAEHCLAPSFAETRWDKIVECYDMLERVTPSALNKLNRAVAVAQWQGPEQGLAALDGFLPPTWSAGSYMWSAVLADLHRRCGNIDASLKLAAAAYTAAPSPAIREVLRRRLQVNVSGA